MGQRCLQLLAVVEVEGLQGPDRDLHPAGVAVQGLHTALYAQGQLCIGQGEADIAARLALPLQRVAYGLVAGHLQGQGGREGQVEGLGRRAAYQQHAQP